MLCNATVYFPSIIIYKYFISNLTCSNGKITENNYSLVRIRLEEHVYLKGSKLMDLIEILCRLKIINEEDIIIS